ncbi:carbohydrate binding domain-containing protein [Dactylosporangium cerinum]
MENGTTGWTVFGSGTLAPSTTAHAGAGSLQLTGRTAAWNGPGQDMTSKLTNGRNYTVSAWVRAQSGTPSAKAMLAVTANGTTSYVQLAPATAITTSGWTQLTGTATVSWTGTLTGATFYVETTSGTDGLLVDDVSLR